MKRGPPAAVSMIKRLHTSAEAASSSMVVDQVAPNQAADPVLVRQIRANLLASSVRWGTRGGWKRWPSPMTVSEQASTVEHFDYSKEHHEVLDRVRLESLVGAAAYQAVWACVRFPADLEQMMGKEYGPDRDKWLNTAQRDAVVAIVLGFNLALIGEPGTGKSTVIKVAAATLDHLQPESGVAVNATTAAAASIIKGSTTHWAWGINKRNTAGVIERMKNSGVAESTLNVTDEISMLEPLQLYALNINACRINRPKDMLCTLETQLPFGGKQMVMSGDFGQLPPVDPDREQPFGRKDAHQAFAVERAVLLVEQYAKLGVTGLRPVISRAKYVFQTPLWWSAFPWGIRLVERMRQREPQFGDILSALRTGTLTESDANILHAVTLIAEDPQDCVRIVQTNKEMDKISYDRMRATGRPVVESWLAMCHATTVDPDRHRITMARKKRAFAAAAREARALNIDVNRTKGGFEIARMLEQERTDQPWPCPLEMDIWKKLSLSAGAAICLCQNIRTPDKLYHNGLTGTLLGFLPIHNYSSDIAVADSGELRRRPETGGGGGGGDYGMADVEATERVYTKQGMPDAVAQLMSGSWMTDVWGNGWRDDPQFESLRALSSDEFWLSLPNSWRHVNVHFNDNYPNTYGVHPLLAPVEWSRTKMWAKSTQDMARRGANVDYTEDEKSLLRYAVPVVRFDDESFGVAIIPPVMHTLCERSNPKVSCVQLPLRANFAATIYRMQGSTQKKVVVDITRASTPGDLTVALSRTRTMGGLKLLQPVPIHQIQADAVVLYYENHCFRRSPP